MKDNKEILVFESDECGYHNTKTGILAKEKYGAEDLIGVGYHGNSYAIPTLDMFGDKLSIDEIRFYIDNLISFAKKNKSMRFLLTKIGTEKYGMTEKESSSLLNMDFPENIKTIMEQELDDLYFKVGLIKGIDVTCSNKVSYETGKSAFKNAKKLSNKLDENIGIYPCAFCKKWHVGNLIPKEILNMFKYIDINKIPKYAVFFGGAMNDTTTKEYTDSILIGKLLAEKGYIVKNGGYRGLMEAVSMGATSIENGKAIGFTCKTFGSVKGNDYLTETIPCEDIYDRLRALITNSELFVVQAGGVGTLSELSLVLDVVRKRNVKPRIFVLGENWSNVMQSVKAIMPENDFNCIIFCRDFEEFKDKL